MSEATVVDPRDLFARLRAELPPDVVEHVFVVGSLAAAYHHVEQLAGGGVKTKDADLVIHPAGHTVAAQEIAKRLIARGWRERKPREFEPGNATTPASKLPAIRLYPPEHEDYFVELLMVPEGEMPGPKPWVAVALSDGFFGLPGFEFLALTTIDRQRGPDGIEYAHPAMMALANLLSHRTLLPHEVSTPIGGRKVQRYAKDLGRVLALARLATVEEMEGWSARWLFALQECFPTRWPELAVTAGEGLRVLVHDPHFEEAWHCCNVGLLAGRNVTVENLEAVARQVDALATTPMETEGRRVLRAERVREAGLLRILAWNFRSARLRAFRAELPGNVDGIKTAQLAYDAAFDRFVPCGGREQAVRSLKPALRDWEGGKDWEELGWRPDGPIRGAYWVEVSADDRDFTVHGVMDADGDGRIAEAVATRTTNATLITGDEVF